MDKKFKVKVPFINIILHTHIFNCMCMYFQTELHTIVHYNFERKRDIEDTSHILLDKNCSLRDGRRESRPRLRSRGQEKIGKEGRPFSLPLHAGSEFLRLRSRKDACGKLGAGTRGESASGRR